MAKEPKVPKGPQDERVPVDPTLLGAEDISAIEKSARKSFLAEMKQDARDALFAKEMAKLRQERIPNERMATIQVDAAPYVPFFMIDGIRFYHGYRYKVRVSQALVLMEQISTPL